MQQRLSIITLGVESLRAAKAFYLDGLGWSEVDQPSDGIVFIQMPAMVLALYPLHGLYEDIGIEAPPDAGPETTLRYPGMTLAYNTSSEEEVDEVMAQAVAAGATKIKDPEKVFWGGYSGYFADPDGHYWEVAHNPFNEPGMDGSLYM